MVVDGDGGNNKRCLKWGGGGVGDGGSHKESFQKHLKMGWIKAKVIRREKGS